MSSNLTASAKSLGGSLLVTTGVGYLVLREHLSSVQLLAPDRRRRRVAGLVCSAVAGGCESQSLLSAVQAAGVTFRRS